jgi:zinc protease
MIIIAALAVAAFSCVSSSARYGALGAETDTLPFMAEARTGVLDNGLRYYILENRKPENRAFLTLAVNAGSVLEEEHERGLAHFVEHMAFNGTEHFAEQELIDYLRSRGMRFGADANASTSYDETIYEIEVPTTTGADGKKYIEDQAFTILDDWTHAINFAEKDVDEERPVIMEEYRARLGAGDRRNQALYPLLFEDSRYTERRPIGLPEIIQTAPAETLKDFYKRYYRPDNMAVIIAGDFDGAALEASLAPRFTAPPPTTPLDRPEFQLPPPQKNRLRTELFTDPELTITRVSLLYKRPAAPAADTIGGYRQSLIDSIIANAMYDRFDDASLKAGAPFTAAYAGEARYVRNSNHYMMIAIAKPGMAEESLAALLREKEKLVRYALTTAEIERAKSVLLSSLSAAASEKEKEESDAFVSVFTEHFLTGEPYPGIEWELGAAEKLLPSIRAAEIKKAAKGYFAGNDLLVFIDANQAETLPAPERIAAIVKKSRSEKIPRPASAAVAASLLDGPPVPGAITSEVTDPATGALFLTLSNGAKVILKETANQNNEVAFFAMARGGTASFPLEDAVSTDLATELSGASGLGPFPLSELSKILADKQVALGFSTGAYTRSVQGSSTQTDLRTFFEYLYLAFTEPRLDEEAASVVLDRYRTELAAQKEDPQAVFFEAIMKALYNDNPRYRPMQLEDLSQVSLETARRFIDRSLNPADFTFVFAGNIGISNTSAASWDIRNLIETYLAAIPQKEARLNTWDEEPLDRSGERRVNVYKGKEEQSYVYECYIVGPAAFSEKQALAANILTEYLEIRLTQEIREKRGGVYSIGLDASLGILPPGGEQTLVVSFGCDPARVDELREAVEAEIRRAATTLDADTLEKARLACLKSLETSMESNHTIASLYASYTVVFGLPLSVIDQRKAIYESVTEAEIQSIVASLVQKEPFRFALYPAP